MLRKILIAAGVLIVLIIGALFALPYLINVEKYHGQIQAQLQKRLGRPVTLGKMQLKLLPPAFRVENAVIGEDPSFGRNAFAQAQQLYVSAELLPLLRGEVKVRSLELTNPKIELIRNSAGVWNFSTLGQAKPAPGKTDTRPAPRGQPEPPPQTTAPAPASPQESEFALAHLAIVGGQIAVTDHHKKQQRTVYDNIDLSVDGYKPNSTFDFELAARLAGDDDQRIAIEGEAGPINQQSVALTPFDGSYEVQRVSMGGLQTFLQQPALQGMAGILTGEGKLKNQGGKFAASGDLNIEQAKIRGAEIGYPITADFDVSGDLNAEQYQINKGKLELGNTPIEIAGTLNAAPTPMQMDLRVKANDASIAEAARLAGAMGVAFNPKTKVEGRVSADLRAYGAANQPQMNGSVRARDINVSGGELQHPVKIPSIELNLTPDTITSNQFTATSGGTTVAANFALSQYTTPASFVRGAIRADNAKLDELLSIAKAYGIEAADGVSGTGPVSINVQAQGPLKNTAAMTFAGNGHMGQGTLKVPSLNSTIQVRNADLRFTANSIVLENMAAAIGETNAAGSLTLRDFNNPNVTFDLRADKWNVAEWQQMLATPPVKQAGLSLVPKAYAQKPEQSLLLRTTGSGTVAVGTLIYDQLTLTDATANVRLDRGIVRLDPVRAQVYGGQHVGAIVADMRPTPPVYKVTSRVERVDANKFISSVSNLKQTLYGILASNANAQFAGGASSEQIARTLNGTLALNLNDGKIANMDLLHELSTIGKFTSAGKAVEPFTKLVQMTGNFNVRNGVAHTDNLRAIIEGGTLAATGDVDLAAQTLNMHLTAVLTQEYSQRVGGTQIGGLMHTALANSKGELVIPVIVTGSFSSPKFAPDVQKIAQMRLENLLPSASNPGQMTTGILGAILGGQQQGQQPGAGGILDALTGRKTRTQQDLPQSDQQQGSQPRQAQPQQQQDPLGSALGAILGEVQKKQEKKKQPPPPEPPK